MDTIRTYETFSVRWDRGSVWSNYTADQAAALIAKGGGTVERQTFEVRVPADMAHLFQPGIAERPAN